MPNSTPGLNSPIPEIQFTAQFIEALKGATLENSNMREEDIARLREASPDFPFDVNDPDFLFSLRIFFSVTTASRKIYNDFRGAALA